MIFELLRVYSFTFLIATLALTMCAGQIEISVHMEDISELDA
jgi:hypothetical protein